MTEQIKTAAATLANTGSGRGTYATAAVLVVGGVLVGLGKLDPSALGLTDTQVEGLIAAVVGVGLAFLRRAIGGKPAETPAAE